MFLVRRTSVAASSLLGRGGTPNLTTCIRGLKHKLSTIQPEFNTTNLDDITAVEANIQSRKGVGNIRRIHELQNDSTAESTVSLQLELRRLPNETHPAVRDYGDEPKEVQTYGTARSFGFKPKNFAELCRKLNILRTDHLGNFTGSKTYYLMNELAELEQALIQYTMDALLLHDFVLTTVPDLLPAEVIEGCGMSTEGERTQVYKVQPSDLCLSGTSEMAIAGYFAGKTVGPRAVRTMAVSRCYRAETSGLQEEKGIYRVHNFTKVEMFAVCHPAESEAMLNEFRDIEIGLFEGLGLHFKLLDMPPCELGAPAYRKYDIEAHMPGKAMFGEISSCSNCTDYQARRLNIRCRQVEGDDNTVVHAHTINGTACAVPRMLIAILENYQLEDGSIEVPGPLRRYMGGKDTIRRTKGGLPELKLIKSLQEEL